MFRRKRAGYRLPRHTGARRDVPVDRARRDVALLVEARHELDRMDRCLPHFRIVGAGNLIPDLSIRIAKPGIGA